MLQLLVQPSFSPHLYFVQDSVHIMIAYAAIFLVKLLLSIPSSIRTEIEHPAMDAIKAAAAMFEKHAAPPASGCGLQAKFLANVLRVFRKAQTQHPQQHGQTKTSQPPNATEQTSAGVINTSQPTSQANAAQGTVEYTQPQQQESMDNPPPYDSFFNDGLQDFAFADAGFSINDGIFLPSFGEDGLAGLGTLGPPT
jgi:hypothetical protein